MSWSWIFGQPAAARPASLLSRHTLTAAEFETVFPILAWQLLFVHGLVIGYHRERIGAFIGARRQPLTIAAGAATSGFIAFALCNPWTEGPRLLHLHLLPPERFAELYAQYFGLEELGAGRLCLQNQSSGLWPLANHCVQVPGEQQAVVGKAVFRTAR